MPANRYRNPLTDILFEQVREFVGVYDVEAAWFTHVNQAGYQLMGYPSAQALYDDPARTLRTRRFTPEEWAQLGTLVLQHGHHEQEMELRRYDGTTFWGQVELTSFPSEGRQYFLVRITDTDRLHTAERHLAQSVGRFEAVFTHATIGIVVCNQQGTITLVNQLAQQQFSYPSEELLGQPMQVLVPGALGQHLHGLPHDSFGAHPQVRARGRKRDLVAHRRDKSTFPVEVSLSYFSLEQELFVVAYIIDSTHKRQAERDLVTQHQYVAQLNAELEQKVADRTHALETTLAQLEVRTRELTQALAAEQELGELKSRFVSMASHEFRTPLTAVLNSAILAGKYTTTEQQAHRERHLARIRTSVKHLTDILEEFLSVGRLEEGRQVVQPVRVVLPDLLQEAIAEVQGLRRPGQHIALELSSPAPLRLDGSLLRKILVNLLSNALKYSGDATTVWVRATAHHQQLALSVQDEGIGISPEDQVHLFERFYRASNAVTIPGTGLGLYIVTKYLELMGGHLVLHSELQVGTTITLTLPYEDHPAN